MSKKLWALFNVVGLAAMVVAAGCGTQNSNSSGVADSSSAAPVSEAKVVWVDSKTYLAHNAIEEKGRSLLKAGDFAAIEKQAALYRKPQEEHLDGFSKLSDFYIGVAQLPQSGTEAEWEERRKILAAWVKRSPRSVTAHVALARCYHDGAYLVRGGGWSSSVGEDQQKVMGERLEKAMEVLSASNSLKNQCPGWFAIAQRVMFLAGRPKAEFDEITDEGLRLFPYYDDYHFMRAKYLMERWYGKAGDWPVYAAQAADKTAKQSNAGQGDALYAKIVWYMQQQTSDETPRELDGIDWPRTKRGFEVLMKEPESFSAVGPYARAAWLTKDRATAKKLFQNTIGNKLDGEVWISEDEFNNVRQWALGG